MFIEAIQMSIGRGLDEQNGVYEDKRVLIHF